MATFTMDPNMKSYDQMSDQERAQYDNAIQMISNMPMGRGFDASMALQKKARPKYTKNKAYDENIALARAQAFGPDRAIQEQQIGIEEGGADSINAARQVSGSTSGLLQALSSINTGKNKALRGLASDQSMIQQQKMASLMGANVMGAEEDDKAWNYNTNQPYQARVNETVEKEKFRRENEMGFMDFIGSLATFIPGVGNLFGGGKGSKKSNVQPGYSGGGGNVGWQPDDGNFYGG